ncbi:MAG: polysaccharide deacetylase family protein [Opitutaceae bacterium]|nr:polysaccharide deacetylase family protein [Opitutaceae bacterium]
MKLPALLVVALATKACAFVLWLAGAKPALAAACFIAPDPFLLWGLFVPSAQGLVRVFTHFATNRREVWLTIDDGPDPEDTPRILDLLDRHGARATFFVIGERAARHPELIREIVRRGHEVAHHTHTHPHATFWCAGPARLAAELDRALAALGEAGVKPRWFRPPVGIKHLLLGRALAQRDLRCVGWTVRSGDSRAGSAAAVVRQVAPRLRSGAIVLLHEGPRLTASVRVQGIALVLEMCAQRGFACVIPRADQLR